MNAQSKPDHKGRTHCIRCGTCCVKGGPALHMQDAVLFEKGVLSREHIYTLRKGEVVRNLDEKPLELKQEMIKIKGRGDAWTCLFFDAMHQACSIYEERPLECRALKCWDLEALRKAMAEPCLTRLDLMARDDGLARIVAAHEKRCAYQTLRAAAKRLTGPHPEEGISEILDLLRYDHQIRPLLTERLKIDPGTLDFLLGRPLTTTIQMFGLQVKSDGENHVLSPLETGR